MKKLAVLIGSVILAGTAITSSQLLADPPPQADIVVDQYPHQASTSQPVEYYHQVTLADDYRNVESRLHRVQEAAAFRGSQVVPGTEQRLSRIEDELLTVRAQIVALDRLDSPAARARAAADLADRLEELQDDLYAVMRSM